MADNPLGSLGNLLGGGLGKALTGFMPQDAPETKLLRATSELSDFQKQEAEILTEIGRKAYEQNPSIWPQADKLKLIQGNIAEAEANLNAAKTAQEQAEAAKAADDAMGRCASCGHKNPEGVKFCQECGGKLGAVFCTGCGATLAAGTRFCGECGAPQV